MRSLKYGSEAPRFSAISQKPPFMLSLHRETGAVKQARERELRLRRFALNTIPSLPKFADLGMRRGIRGFF